MKLKPINIIVITLFYLFACFQIEKMLSYDVFFYPYYHLFIKTILFVAIQILFAFLICDMLSASYSRNKAIFLCVLLSISSWFIYKTPQLLEYSSRPRFKNGVMNPIAYLEWVEIIFLVVLVAYIYQSRKGFIKDKKSMDDEDIVDS